MIAFLFSFTCKLSSSSVSIFALHFFPEFLFFIILVYSSLFLEMYQYIICSLCRSNYIQISQRVLRMHQNYSGCLFSTDIPESQARPTDSGPVRTGFCLSASSPGEFHVPCRMRIPR